MAWFLVGHGPAPVCGPGIGDPWFRRHLKLVAFEVTLEKQGWRMHTLREEEAAADCSKIGEERGMR